MHISKFQYDLPTELIAQKPLAERTASRLLYLGNELEDLGFTQLLDKIKANDLLVFNNTKVIPARLYGHKETGGKVEILIERILSSTQALVQLKASKKPKIDSIISLECGTQLKIYNRQEQWFSIQLVNQQQNLLDLLEKVGHIPLPPYIKREDQEQDKQRYQTVYAEHPGAVAAPTAGLHFDQELINKIQQQGIKTTHITLHVGAGTFQPVRVNNIKDHKMHNEFIEVSQQTCELVKQTQQQNGRIIAVGTTSVRALETASTDGIIKPFKGKTNIFIYPGYHFNCIDALITNFHLSESTLLMLVSALGGYEQIMSAYQHAIQKKYRFFSYGDAMMILNQAR
ncbi:MAG: tRNA preQ1(34) S-adenosylmethionine ribosyltransferase-isomerase QueA [Methylococcales bacterium]|jgi:S-adenosylmethionine:tRNA ribosyltransferase-isomerase|nr:tRNA preQ1(34) S-adenosylmethionine ribosyltransferase-isomerase QueA [Methylococcales bacterium]MBT7409068.1 tRNA preQ1(34) S-adenosylmethionine ribosyltransferase-isomerase QueA [Methylococcales bacterium]